LIHHKPSSIKAANSHLRCHILPLLGKTKLEELGLEEQQGFITRLAEAVARKTAINVMGTLSVMLSTAKNWGYICEPVEFGKLTMPYAGSEGRGLVAFSWRFPPGGPRRGDVDLHRPGLKRSFRYPCPKSL
jgi:hypothetical protein